MPQKNMLDNLENFVKELFTTVIANESEEGHIRFCRLVNDALDVYKAPWFSSWTRTRDEEIKAEQKVFEAFKGSENRLPSLVELISNGTWYQDSFNTILLRTFIAAVPGYQKLDPKDEETAIGRIKVLLLISIENFQKEQKNQQQIALKRKEDLEKIKHEESASSKAIAIKPFNLAKDYAKSNAAQATFSIKITEKITKKDTENESVKVINLIYFDPYGHQHLLDAPQGLKDLFKNVTERLNRQKKTIDDASFQGALTPIELRQLKIECVCARDDFLRLISLEYHKDDHEEKKGVFFLENTADKIKRVDGKLNVFKKQIDLTDATIETCKELSKSEGNALVLKDKFSDLLRYLDELSVLSKKIMTEEQVLSEKLSYVLPEIDFDNDCLALQQVIDEYNVCALELHALMEKYSRLKNAGKEDRLDEIKQSISLVKKQSEEVLTRVFAMISNPLSDNKTVFTALQSVYQSLNDKFLEDATEDKDWILSYRDIHGGSWKIDSKKDHPKLFDFLKGHPHQILDEERSLLKALLLDVKTSRNKEIDPKVKADLEACFGKPKPKMPRPKLDRAGNPINYEKYKDVVNLYQKRAEALQPQERETNLLDRSLVTSVAGLFGATVAVNKQFKHPTVIVSKDAPPAPPPPKF